MNSILDSGYVSERSKTLLGEHEGRIKMNNEKSGYFNDDEELKNSLVSRLINWKFGQALMYKDALKYKDSIECLRLLEKLWGDTGWDRGDTLIGLIISYLVEFIRLKEEWKYEEFYDEKEEIDVI